jgi:hypothetical protein
MLHPNIFSTKRALAPVPFQKKETTRFLQQVLKAKRVQQKLKTTTKYSAAGNKSSD